MNTIGRYQVVGRLGRGGMATVYKALAPVTGRLTAVKLLRPRDVLLDLVGEEQLCRTFLEEARVMGGLDHPHLARILDCDFHQGRPFFVLEYYAHSLGSFIGESYRVEAPSRLVSLGKTRDYLCQALLGLERLHFAGVVHRDIKPYNLMITSDDRVKIIDFGLSRVRGEESVRPPGMQVGSPFYAAPEQERTPEAVDGRADLYSLAVMALRMLSGRLFDSRRTLGILLDEVQVVCGNSWREWLEKGLRWRPAERFADARQMRLALQALKVVPGSPKAVAAEPWPVVPRRLAKRILYKDIGEELDLDALLRPRRFCGPQLIDQGARVRLDRRTGLTWQRLGAGFPLNWYQAGEYVRQLNERGEGGHGDWRLPTCEELRTVLSPSSACCEVTASALFDPSVHWLWSCDPSTKKQAWSVDVIEGFFERLDRDGTASVCAVRSSSGG
jgi:Protein kinase domain/Protein of unknown function (DUF1566)